MIGKDAYRLIHLIYLNFSLENSIEIFMRVTLTDNYLTRSEFSHIHSFDGFRFQHYSHFGIPQVKLNTY